MEKSASPTNIDYIITFYFLMLTTKTSFIYYIDLYWFAFAIGALVYGFSQKRIYEKDIYVFTTFSLFFLGYILFRNFFINKLPTSFLLSDIYYLIRFIFAAYVFCVVLKENAVRLFVNVVFLLSAISLFFYAVQLAGGGNILFQIGKAFIITAPATEDLSSTFSNFLIFSYDQVHVYRNSGFVWEPGAFGCFIIIAMFFNFLRNDFSYDRITIVLIIALITTLSTTSYLALGILIFLSYRARGGKWNLGLITVCIAMVMAFIFLPFLGDKITDTYYEDVQTLEDVEIVQNELEYYTDYGGEVKLNRFASAIFLYRHFEKQLVFGVSNAYIKLDSKIYGVGLDRFNTSNGLMDFISKFGLLGLIFVFVRIYQFCYLKLKSNEFSSYFILVFLILNFGEPILMLPVTLMFLFFPNFNTLDKDEMAEPVDADLIIETENS